MSERITTDQIRRIVDRPNPPDAMNQATAARDALHRLLDYVDQQDSRIAELERGGNRYAPPPLRLERK